ncbi:polyprenol-phosphate-mannose-dependent alpha-(1-2)-phosphatidylinositol pentamannoside mannosyltransferase [Actinoplanes capillaceus]|uniref:Polyprenol-phosphate-mannose-dependent alpha-(1-2)-phosphatidylinositol pentamannoside mannosyltransferase n=1 Tax=Actinoplanes campanulatus TaxID=113559 RepID=A0ABQ3WCH9_9ACTN|nr:glycosyltransferase 87 family protein [Actinoplanes capillaceus]GID44731.1 polyprenol-phosphate-mannose-dependent alpha-(1-2)-phosphatidylinositol pentamannoside mannosyltransferase [Actinoplanes capillaceus]
MKRKAIVAVLALITVTLIVIAGFRNTYFDSRVYYGAIVYWFRDGGMVYDFLRPGTPYGFTYPPFAGLVMYPMSLLPLLGVMTVATIMTVATTALLVHWLAGPEIERRGWTRWFALSVAVCLALSFEPVRETITFGQVNMLLLALVAGDMLFGLARGRRWAGVGIGLATAIKLTPGVFILYLLVTRRWRALGTAIGAAAGATLMAGAIFPDESREFWTSALWDTNRVGLLYFLSNQSERGLLARLPIEVVESRVWLVCVLATMAVWAWRVARSRDDVVGGLALTGILGCLISPVTWIHHCVWLIPALVLCILHGRPYLGWSAYLLMTSHVTWLWEKRPRPPLELIGGNIYVWFSLALLIWTPVGTRRSSDVHEPDKIIA